uniref:Uncharacterized protein n=1 Tax=Panagrolaimus sp. ES5 TaxID=591445 RepID=A0AC34GTC7_9BILA
MYKLASRGVNFSTVPPTVPESAKEWALSRGMPPILRARTEMLIEYQKFMCSIPDDLNHLPPDGSLNTVYKHAMREDLSFNERMELLDELFLRTCNNVSQKWCLILTQKVPYPALGRAYRRNPQIFKEYKMQPKELSFSY